jgi:predicted branched-subunit amino acid permease
MASRRIVKEISTSRYAALRLGAWEAFGVPGAVLSAGFIGYGALAADAGYSLIVMTFSTLAIWALPGQLVLHEMYVVGAAWFAIVPAVMLTAARFLPMTLTLLPVLREGPAPRWRYYAAAHFIAMTSWAIGMRRCPELPRGERLAYFFGFSLTCWILSVMTGIVGFFIGGSMPQPVRIAFVFLTPLYFLVMLVGEMRRATATALVCGAVCGPLFYLANPQWSVPLAGVVGGTLAYAAQRALRANDA